MARARNIKPGFYRDASLVELPVETRLLFPGLWMLADREGRLEDKPKQIKMEIYPADSFDVVSMLQQLADANLIIRYESDGARYIQIRNFTKHQNPHHMEAPSVIPPPPGASNTYNHTPIAPKTRARIYERDGHKCAFCGATENLQIDHVQLVSNGGDSSDDNLRTLCAQCNNKRSKTGKSEVNRADSLIPDSLTPESKPTPDKPARFDPVAMPLPACLHPTDWSAWISYRRARKLTTAEPTMLKQLQFLTECNARGQPPAAIINASITNGWQGLFEQKAGGSNGKNGSSRADRISATIAELTGANRHPAAAIDGVATRVD